MLPPTPQAPASPPRLGAPANLSSLYDLAQRFAYFPPLGDYSFSARIEQLAAKAENELWNDGYKSYGGLERFIKYFFKFIIETQPEVIKFSQDGMYAAFRLPLFSRSATGGEPIYAVFKPNISNGQQPYFLMDWFVGWTKRALLGEAPIEADMYKSTNKVPDRWWMFDESAHVEYELMHILDDPKNLKRLHEICSKFGRTYTDEDVADKFFRACEASKKRIKPYARSGEIRPQLYPPGTKLPNGEMGSGFDNNDGRWYAQLLLPLSIHDPRTADAALALEIQIDAETNKVCYLARTMLTVDMAYWNTRLIARVATTWLKDSYNNLVDTIAQQAELDALREENTHMHTLLDGLSLVSTSGSSQSGSSQSGSPSRTGTNSRSSYLGD